jgi:hypothetical protein
MYNEVSSFIPEGGSVYMPIVPHKTGFKEVTIYKPEAAQVERLLKKLGYWEGGSTSSISTPTLETPRFAGDSGPDFLLSNNPFSGVKIEDLVSKVKNKLPTVAGAATGATLPFLSPDEVEAERARYAQLEREQALGSPIVDPIDILLAPIGAVGAGAKAAAMAVEPFISYGMDKAINGLLGLFSDEED